ncbi:Isochorismatase family (plasmid) [Tsukamurella tyrosinosolvens]|uniref:Isochorismatase family protein n=1 Tax=Tsukamurella tyrosinosolvens TaxID=57704 RepID=A0A1H4UVE0_TSUTY|nr:isochorismatase family protein [Tsukamurella tyrosinosolvens]KXO98397.1 hypothetical protein AXK58_25325 [Tsukamurella tyrosinosolvens]SEC72697.1 Isochorismatase family protein [Tsukamurella tyrosinosolvens]VEH90857.1 Isochorismatase family [Tsukamurella tyrosinosolvens]
MLAVDVQHAFLTAKVPADLPARIAAFIALLGPDQVVATRYVNMPKSPCRELMGWTGAESSPDTDLHRAVAERATRVLTKNTYGLPAVPEFAGRVYVVGLDTDVCVHAAATQLFDAGIDVAVVADLCASAGGAEAHLAGLTALTRVLGRDRILPAQRVLRP